MKCRQVKRQLSAYSDGALEAQPVRRIEEHLNTCPSCRGALTSQEDTWMLLDAAPEPESSAHFYLRLKTRMAHAEDAPPSWRERLWVPALTAAVLVVGILVGGYVGMNGSPTTEWANDDTVSPLDLNSFEDFPEASFGEVYYELAGSEGRR